MSHHDKEDVRGEEAAERCAASAREPETEELADEDLEKVAGGVRIAVYKKPVPHSGSG